MVKKNFSKFYDFDIVSYVFWCADTEYEVKKIKKCFLKAIFDKKLVNSAQLDDRSPITQFLDENGHKEIFYRVFKFIFVFTTSIYIGSDVKIIKFRQFFLDHFINFIQS